MAEFVCGKEEILNIGDSVKIRGADTKSFVDIGVAIMFKRDGVYTVDVHNGRYYIFDAQNIKPERKKGHWDVDEDGNVKCPFCRNFGFGNFCCECGADMRGE